MVHEQTMIPYCSKSQMALIDELMINDYKIPVCKMMELAGFLLAQLLKQRFPHHKKVLIVAGKGNNGGDGIAAARHLFNWGYQPTILLASKEVKEDPQRYKEIAEIMGIHVEVFSELSAKESWWQEAEVIVDGLLGYNLQGKPREPYATIIKTINASNKPILSIDLPSGIDADKGIFQPVYVKATIIAALSLPKQGTKQFPAEQYVLDIGIPPALYAKVGLPAYHYFAQGSILKLS